MYDVKHGNLTNKPVLALTLRGSLPSPLAHLLLGLPSASPETELSLMRADTSHQILISEFLWSQIVAATGENTKPKIGKKGRITLFYNLDSDFKWPVISVFVNIQKQIIKITPHKYPVNNKLLKEINQRLYNSWKEFSKNCFSKELEAVFRLLNIKGHWDETCFYEVIFKDSCQK